MGREEEGPGLHLEHQEGMEVMVEEHISTLQRREEEGDTITCGRLTIRKTHEDKHASQEHQEGKESFENKVSENVSHGSFFGDKKPRQLDLNGNEQASQSEVFKDKTTKEDKDSDLRDQKMTNGLGSKMMKNLKKTLKLNRNEVKMKPKNLVQNTLVIEDVSDVYFTQCYQCEDLEPLIDEEVECKVFKTQHSVAIEEMQETDVENIEHSKEDFYSSNHSSEIIEEQVLDQEKSHHMDDIILSAEKEQEKVVSEVNNMTSKKTKSDGRTLYKEISEETIQEYGAEDGQIGSCTTQVGRKTLR